MGSEVYWDANTKRVIYRTWDGLVYLKPIPLLNINYISAGLSHSLAIDEFGQTWSWGYNASGQLGRNDINSRSKAASVCGDKKTFCNIAYSSAYHSFAIDYTGEVWGWGINDNAQLGDESNTSRLTPISLYGTRKFIMISCGMTHSIGIDNTGIVWGWGYNKYGELGNGTTTDEKTPVSIIGIGTEKQFNKISAGAAHSNGVNINGEVWSWGNCNFGQLGTGNLGSEVTPVALYNTGNFCHITSGYYHSAAIDNNGLIWCWGYNVEGELGNGSTTSEKTPVSINGDRKTFCYINSGPQSTYNLAIDYNGLVWGWGMNNFGQLGIGSTVCTCTPVSILGTRKTFCQVSTGVSHSIGLDNHSRVWTWGKNDYGQLGDNSTTSRLTPIMIEI